jgi:excisionase family DNA binding protein
MSNLLTSAEVARLAGVGQTAVKRWSDSGRLPCVKTAGGHRRFERREVERLLRAEHDGNWQEWIDALVAGDVHAVQGKLFAERSLYGSWHGAADVAGDLLAEIGRRWSDGRLSVIDEHLASATLHRALAAVADSLPLAIDAPRALLATTEGDSHTLGLSLVELCLREAGWRTEWAGSPTRTIDVVERIERGGLAMVALSAAASARDEHQLRDQAEAIGSTCRARRILFALGGAGAWPETVTFGRRFTSLAAFSEWARTMDLSPAS